MRVLVSTLLLAWVAAGEDAVTPGEFLTDPPTLENLGFRWYIEGDDNRNATVDIAYRRKRDGVWRDAHPMLRVNREVANQDYGPYRAGNLFAGSVLFLQPDTDYEVRFTMRDPDGGAAPEKIVAASTRAEPRASRGGRTRRVRSGQTQALVAAYQAAQPGDIIALDAGIYRFDTPLTLNKTATAGQPIVIRGPVNGQAVLEGSGHETDLLNVEDSAWLILENLTLRKAKHAILAGRKGGPGARFLTVRRCRIEDVIYGITTSSENSTGWYIADNDLIGINPTWYPRPNVGYMSPGHTGINVYGQGNIAAYNRITRFSDGIAPANFGPPSEDRRKHPVNIDIYGNDVSWAQDDCIETDYGAHNFRVYRNRCTNAHTGISVQPFYGGPVYLVRNEIYGVTSLTFKLHNYCAGIEAYHNTVSSAGSGFQSFDRWQNGHFRNNLFLGGEGNPKAALAMMTGTLTPYSTMDYDGYRRNAPGPLVRWFNGRMREVYDTLDAFSEATGLEPHGLMVDYDVFVKAAPPRPGVTSDFAQVDLRPRQGASIVDRGVPLPGINDGYSGKAPDLGCYELGAAVPRYGPRTR